VSVLDQRFPRANRLTKPSDFTEVFKSPKRLDDGNFIILFKPNGLGRARLGLAISRKNIRLASARNRIKRIIRESFRRSKDELKGFDIVVVAKRNINNQNHSIIARSIAGQWKKVISA